MCLYGCALCTVQHLQVFTKTVYICMTTRVYSFCAAVPKRIEEKKIEKLKIICLDGCAALAGI